MRKTYNQPEWKVIAFNEEDIVKTSDSYGFGDGDFGGDSDKVDNWEW